MSIYNGGRRLPPLPSDANGYPTSDPFATGAGAAANAIASGLNPTTPPPFITKGPSTNSPGSNVSGQPWPTTAPPATPSATPGSPSTPGQWGGTHYSTAAGSAAKWNADGSYTLPSGETLGAGNTFTLGVGGQQVRVAGNYNGSNQALWQNNGVGETAMDRFSRRLNDLAATGANVNDPNVQYDTMARVRDDASAALQQRLGRPPTAQELQQATGFAHIDRFARGQNGETGFQGPQGLNTAWQTAIQNVTGTPSAAPPTTSTPTPSTAGAPPQVSAQTGYNPGAGSTTPVQQQVTASQGITANKDGAIPSVNNDLMIQNPEEMLRVVLGKMGINHVLSGPFASYFTQRLGQIIDAAAQVGTLGGAKGSSGIDNLQNILGQVAQSAQGGHFFGDMAGMAQGGLSALASNPLVANAGYDAQNKLMGNVNFLNGVGMNPYAAAGLDNMYQQANYDYMAKARQQPLYDTPPGDFGKYLGGTQIGQYYGMKP
jgi:hypothetical protein